MDEIPIDAILRTGRLLRQGHFRGGQREAAYLWFATHITTTTAAVLEAVSHQDACDVTGWLRAHLSGEAVPDGWARQSLHIRDDIETYSYVLGIASVFKAPARSVDTIDELGRWEHRVLDIARGLDLLGEQWGQAILTAADGSHLPHELDHSGQSWWLPPWPQE